LEGIALAKASGKYRGRKRSVSDVQIATIKARVAAGEKKAQIARYLGISRETLNQIPSFAGFRNFFVTLRDSEEF